MEIKKKIKVLRRFKLQEEEEDEEEEEEKGISRLNSAAEPPRRHRDKGGEMAERSSVVAMNGVDSLSLSLSLSTRPGPGSLLLFRWVLDVWVFFGLYLKVTCVYSVSVLTCD